MFKIIKYYIVKCVKPFQKIGPAIVLILIMIIIESL